MARIVAIGTAVPPYAYEQDEVRDFSRKIFAGSIPQLDRLLTIFDSTAIKCRHFSKPTDWLIEKRSFRERNQAYLEIGCQIGEEAVRRCLTQTEISPQQVDHLIFVSTTGLATPSLDAYLINRLQMSPHIKRTPIWGLGCAGGVAGLARAFEYVKAFPEQTVLLVALELCGLTFRQSDHSKSNFVATSLFSDGAAAVLITGEKDKKKNHPSILATESMIWPRSTDVMGWGVEDDGLKVIFSKDIPTIVKREVRPVVDRFLQKKNLQLGQIDYFISHPGGRKVLEAYQKALEVPEEKFHHAYEVLRDYGNMSSATVLFVLKKELEKPHRKGSYGLMTALGPGFSSELALLYWDQE